MRGQHDQRTPCLHTSRLLYCLLSLKLCVLAHGSPVAVRFKDHLTQISTRCGGIASIISWGKSAKGQDLFALELYGGAASEQYRPGFKYVGNLHGDEPSGRQLLLALADHLCKGYIAKSVEIVRLLQTVSMVIIPTANPDGFDGHTRENSNGIDLNRNYPDPIINSGHDLRQPLGKEAVETLAMMNFTLSRRFIGSLALHEGALVANYPFDGYSDGHHGATKGRHPTPDDSTFVHLARLYANLHTTMANASPEFPEGITNGAQWYPVYGGMQDWNYLAAGCMELTLELNGNKWPDLGRLAAMWQENAAAMVKFPLAMVLGGLTGSVISDRNESLVATLHVEGQGMNTTSAPMGDFYRPLAPGNYKVLVQSPGHEPSTVDVEVPSGNKGTALGIILKSIAKPPANAQMEVTQGDVDLADQWQLTGLHVMVYILGVPLLLGVAFVFWQQTQDNKRLQPWYQMIGMSGGNKYPASLSVVTHRNDRAAAGVDV